MDIPQVPVGQHQISRMVAGTNMFLGFSHMSDARDKWLCRYFDEERITEVLRACSDLGVTAAIGPADARLAKALGRHERETGHHLTWIATTYGRGSVEGEIDDIHWLRDQGAEFCLVQAGYTDTNLCTSEKRVVGLDRLVSEIRECGMAPGVSTHRPEALNVCEEAGYGLEVYALPLNAIGFLSPVETNWVSTIIRDTHKPVVVIKPLASGRLMPADGLRFAFSSIKKTDLVAVGLLSPEEAIEDATIVSHLLTGATMTEATGGSVILPTTPSKRSLGQKREAHK